MKKRKGQFEVPMSMFAIILIILLMFQFVQSVRFHVVRSSIEDGLAASNLAAALIDLEEYGISHKIVIKEPTESYAIFKTALQANMHLDGDYRPYNQAIFEDAVNIESFIIYNVNENDIEVITQNEDTYQVQMYENSLGTLQAPNGIVIESTSIYSEITFQVQVIYDIYVEARGSKLIDIISNEESEFE